MRKLRKFLRILLILLPFSVSVASAANEHAGGTSYGGSYDHWTYVGDTNVSWDNLTYVRSRDPQWVSQLRRDVANSSLSPSFTAEARQFLLMWNYTHYFGSLENQPEQVENVDSYLPSNFYAVGFQMRPAGYPFYWNIIQKNGYGISEPYRGTLEGPFVNGSYDFNRGHFKLHIDSYATGDTADEIKFIVNDFYGLPNRFTDINTNAYSVTVTEGSATYENGRLIYNDNSSVSLTVLFHTNENGDYFFNMLEENVIPEIVAPETPELTYPTQTYYDNSTGDTVTNNYYDKEINYYNYMTNAVDVLEDKVDPNYFEEQTQNGFSWGLLSLPAGLTAGMLEALGEYSSVCKFSTQPMSLNILGGHYLHIPAMSFTFNADDYPWLLPFRYIIALSLLYVLCKQGWILLANIINGGTGDE